MSLDVGAFFQKKLNGEFASVGGEGVDQRPSSGGADETAFKDIISDGRAFFFIGEEGLEKSFADFVCRMARIQVAQLFNFDAFCGQSRDLRD